VITIEPTDPLCSFDSMGDLNNFLRVEDVTEFGIIGDSGGGGGRSFRGIGIPHGDGLKFGMPTRDLLRE